MSMNRSKFSTTNTKPSSEASANLDDDKLSVEEIMKYINMDELKQFNPKLHDQIANNP